MLTVAPATGSRQTGSSEPNRYLVIDNPTLLERTILESTPLARAMDLSVLEYDGNRLALHAPLASNVNDKGCAFGGSMVSLMTLAGWGLVKLKLGEADCSADVFVADSRVTYLDPLWDELVAEAGDARAMFDRVRTCSHATVSHGRLPPGPFRHSAPSLLPCRTSLGVPPWACYSW